MSTLTIHYPVSGSEAGPQIARKSFGRLSLFTLTFIMYFAGSLAGFALQLPGSIHSHEISVIWPPNAVLVSLLLLLPAARWPAVLLGALAAHFITQELVGVPIWLMGLRFANNCILTILIAGVVKTILGQKRFSFDSLRSAIVFLVIGVTIAPAITAIFPTLVRTSMGLSTHFWDVWRSLVLSDALSISILTPLLIALFSEFLESRSPARLNPLRLLEFAVLFGGVGVVEFVIFSSIGSAHPVRMPALICLPLPFLLWAALRFGPAGISLLLLMVAVVCIRSALEGFGPFALSSPEENTRAIQYFLLALGLPQFCLAVVARERALTISRSLEREAVAREQYAQLSNIYRNAPIGLAFMDTHQVFHEVNEFLAGIHGLSVADHVGRSVDEVLAPEVARMARTLCEYVIDTGEDDINREMLGPSSAHSNELRNWLVSHYPVKDAGIIIGVIVILQDITERKRAEAQIHDAQLALHASLDRIQDLTGRLIQVQEVERTRIARELHDDVNQQLAALSMALSGLKRRVPANTEVRKGLDAVQKRAIDLTDEVRSICHGLHSGVLQHVGLAPALRAYCGELQGRLGVATSFAVDESIGEVPADISLCLYRVVQEAMTNVLRHAHATRTDVTLGVQNDGIELSVSDDGRGFDVSGAAASRGLGLISMDERVRMVRGKVNITSQPGRGTTIQVWVPRK
jgi:PAS domain S-box-containing protein